MDAKELMYQRRSIRKFSDKKIDDEIIKDLLECAMAAPSACNKQPWEFYIIKNEELVKQTNDVSKYCAFNAPLVIMIAGNLRRSLQREINDFFYQDCAAACENILLRATSLGLGTTWCGLSPMITPQKRIKKLLAIDDEDIIPIALIKIGYPLEEKEARTQYNDKYVHYYE